MMKLYRDSLSWSFELIKINMIKLKLKHTKSGKETILKWSYKSWQMLNLLVSFRCMQIGGVLRSLE